jgi:hypothetical protein
VFVDALVPPQENFLEPGSYLLVAHYTNRQTSMAQHTTKSPVDFTASVASEPVAFRVTKPTATQRDALRRFQEALYPNRPAAERAASIADTLAVGDLPPNLRARLLVQQAAEEHLVGDVARATYLLEQANQVDSSLSDRITLQLGELALKSGDRGAATRWLRQSQLRRARFLLEESGLGTAPSGTP